MNAWVPLLTAALEFAIQQAKTLGLPPPVAEEIDKIKRAVDEKLGEILPLAIVGVALGAVAVAADANHRIDSLGTSPRCGRCGAVAVQHVEKTVDGPGAVRLTCSECTWTLP